MNTTRKKIQTLISSGLLTLFLGISQSSHAALALPDSPLFIGTGPQPNIFFALDDSGSMDWDILVTNVAQAVHPGDSTTFEWLDPTPSQPEEWRQFCRDYNVLAYDPNVTYDPWSGKNDSSTVYTDAPVNAAPFNPYESSGPSVDLENAFCQEGNLQNDTACGTNNIGFFYIEPNDANGDGSYDALECMPPLAQIPDNSDYFKSAVPAGGQANLVFVRDMTAAQKQNYANWFSFYRSRDFVLKRAVSELIDNSQAFMGIATLHNNNSVGTPVSDMSVTTNKDNLQDELGQVVSVGGTPLRQLLNNVGQYFDDTDGSDAPSTLGFTDPSPILSAADGGECQQNFAVVMSDGFWNGSNPSGIDNEDGDDDTGFDGGPHADTFSDTLADVAMKYYESDLSTLDDLVPEIENIDTNTAQHLVTYTVAFGLTGTGVTTPPDHDDATPPPPWPQPVADTATALDDMQHAAFNGRGLFLNAADPQELITSLSEALGDVEQRTSFSAAAVAVNSTVLRTSSRLFQAQFSTIDYSGELSAFTLNTDGTLDTEVWKATNNFPAEDDRKILTTITKSGDPEVIEFDNDDPDAGLLQTAVGVSSVGGTAANLIDYIRGDQSMEVQDSGIFRDREVLLGDIVNSSPLSVGAINFFYDRLDGTEGSSYPAFLNAKIARFTDSVSGDPFSYVYVGANDGMLHSFDSRTGAEEFAYVPQVVHGNLDLLSEPDYGHKFYVDATPSSADAYFNTPGEWRTVLAGSLGKGGRTVYAMDITDPGNFSEDDVLWEFTTTTSVTTDNELGFVFHRPQIVRLNNDEWGVIFGNGFNSDSESAQLIILDVQDGSIIKIIDTEVGDSTNTNGLSMPFLLDEDGDLSVDTAYAGDLQGNLWKFDLTGNANNWDVAFSGPPGNTPLPLYTAVDDQGTSNTSDDEAQPITSRPVVVNHPDGGFMVLFGTGKYIENSDNLVPADPLVHTFYGIRDFNDTVPAGRGNLVEQNILADIDIVDSGGEVINTARVVSEEPVEYQPGTVDGWFIDLLTPTEPPSADGEMVIANPLARFGRVIFTTFIPGDTPCDRGGQSVIMELDAISGARLENSVFDYNQDGVIDADDFVDESGNLIPGSGIFIPATLASPAVISAEDASAEFKQTSGIDTTVTTTMETTGGLTVGRQSWRQLE